LHFEETQSNQNTKKGKTKELYVSSDICYFLGPVTEFPLNSPMLIGLCYNYFTHNVVKGLTSQFELSPYPINNKFFLNFIKTIRFSEFHNLQMLFSGAWLFIEFPRIYIEWKWRGS